MALAGIGNCLPDTILDRSVIPKGAVLRVRGARRSWFDQAVETSCMPAGLHPHELRHTAVSLAVSAGANVKAVQLMLGHAKASMTLDVYADLFDDDLEAVADRLDELRAAGARKGQAGRSLILARFVQAVDLRVSGWRRRDLNPQPPPCKGGALPVELRPRRAATRVPAGAGGP